MTSYFVSVIRRVRHVVKNLDPKSNPKIVWYCKRSCLVANNIFKCRHFYSLAIHFWPLTVYNKLKQATTFGHELQSVTGQTGKRCNERKAGRTEGIA